MTKADLVAGPVWRHHVADLHLAVGDDHAVEQQLNQRPSLLECRLGQALSHPPAEVLNGAGEPGEFLLPVCPRLKLFRLRLELALALLKVASALAVLVQQDDTGELGLGQPLELLPEARLPPSQSLLTRLQLLRQPLSAMRPRQGA